MPDNTSLPQVPESRVVPKKRARISLVWVIPIVAAVAGVWIAATRILGQGPAITITFESAEGLEAGKTKINFNGLDIGKLTDIRLAPDHKHVLATAQMEPKTEEFLVKDTKFWVVRPRVSGLNITGLGTLISGHYIGVEPGQSRASARKFVALDEPPMVAGNTPGRFFLLKTPELGSLGMVVWSTAAIYYSNLPAPWLRTAAAGVFALGVGVLFVRMRPRWLARVIFLAAFAGIVLWFLRIPPSNDRDWQPDLAVLPYADINGDSITIHNIRNCDYRTETDYTVRHYDKTLDLTKLRTVDLFVVYWGSPMIAHTMLSFGFEGGDYVCFSIETRKEKGEGYSAVKGLFRQFELTYIVADERDLVRLRTNYRNEQVYLYRLNVDAATARLVFLDYFKSINHLKDQPEWYNAITSNCTTDVHQHTYPYAKKTRWDWRILINGYVDELAYELKTLDQSLPFAELKKRSLINDVARAADQDPDFSARIRAGLPAIAAN